LESATSLELRCTATIDGVAHFQARCEGCAVAKRSSLCVHTTCSIPVSRGFVTAAGSWMKLIQQLSKTMGRHLIHFGTKNSFAAAKI
jgi:hypothetical protein